VEEKRSARLKVGKGGVISAIAFEGGRGTKLVNQGEGTLVAWAWSGKRKCVLRGREESRNVRL